MSSRFQLIKWEIAKKPKFTINEVFVDNEEIIGINNKPVILEATSLEELRHLMVRAYEDMEEFGVFVETEDSPVDAITKDYYDIETEERVEDLVDIFGRNYR